MEARELINKLERLHREHAVDELTDQFAEPLIVFPVEGPSRRAWRKDTRISVERLFAANKAAGVASIFWDELALEKQVSGNQSILVRWHYLDFQGALVANSEIRYFCGPAGGSDLKVLMIEYLSLGFPSALTKMPKSSLPRKPS